MYLTLPVKFKALDTLDNVLIDHTKRWMEKHQQAIITNYSKAKYFKNYSDFFSEVYKRNWTKLNDINYFLLPYLLQQLNIKTKIIKSSDLNIKGEATERLVNVCKEIGADTYLTGDYAAGVYLDVDVFKKNNIEVVPQNWKAPKYNQLFLDADFIYDLSIIDLLFNEGEKSRGTLLNE